jgi:hypothetical protein
VLHVRFAVARFHSGVCRSLHAGVVVVSLLIAPAALAGEDPSTTPQGPPAVHPHVAVRAQFLSQEAAAQLDSIACSWRATNDVRLTGYLLAVRVGGRLVATKSIAANRTSIRVGKLRCGKAYVVTLIPLGAGGTPMDSASARYSTAKCPDPPSTVATVPPKEVATPEATIFVPPLVEQFKPPPPPPPPSPGFRGLGFELSLSSIGFGSSTVQSFDEYYQGGFTDLEKQSHWGFGLKAMGPGVTLALTFQSLAFQTRSDGSRYGRPITYTVSESMIDDFYFVHQFPSSGSARVGLGAGLSLGVVQGTILYEAGNGHSEVDDDFSNSGVGLIAIGSFEWLPARHLGMSLTVGARSLSVQSTSQEGDLDLEKIELGGPFVRLGLLGLLN